MTHTPKPATQAVIGTFHKRPDLPYEVYQSFGVETPHRVGCFESYKMARYVATSRVKTNNALRQPMFAKVMMGDQVVYEVSRVIGPRGGVHIVVDRDIWP